jgi:hypothetical protein
MVGTNERYAITDAGQIIYGVVPANYANDAAAATGGVPVGGLYRNASQLMVRVT